MMKAEASSWPTGETLQAQAKTLVAISLFSMDIGAQLEQGQGHAKATFQYRPHVCVFTVTLLSTAV